MFVCDMGVHDVAAATDSLLAAGAAGALARGCVCVVALKSNKRGGPRVVEARAAAEAERLRQVLDEVSG